MAGTRKPRAKQPAVVKEMKMVNKDFVELIGSLPTEEAKKYNEKLEELNSTYIKGFKEIVSELKIFSTVSTMSEEQKAILKKML